MYHQLKDQFDEYLKQERKIRKELISKAKEEVFEDITQFLFNRNDEEALCSLDFQELKQKHTATTNYALAKAIVIGTLGLIILLLSIGGH